MGWGRAILALHAQLFEIFGFDVYNLAILLHHKVAVLLDGALDESALCQAHTAIYLLLQLCQIQFAHSSIILLYDSGSKISLMRVPCPQAICFTPSVPLLS